MTHLLQVNSSIFHDAGESTRLAYRFVEWWRARNFTEAVTIRELGDCPIPHLDAERFHAFSLPSDQRSPEQQAAIELSDALIAELKGADILIIGAPTYNFTIPSGLKSYIDHIARSGETFRYTAAGPIGLLEGKRAVVISTRGGPYSEAEDLVAPYLSKMFKFLGFVDVKFVFADGLAISDEARARGLALAERRLLATVEELSALWRRAEDQAIASAPIQ